MLLLYQKSFANLMWLKILKFHHEMFQTINQTWDFFTNQKRMLKEFGHKMFNNYDLKLM